MSSKKQLTINIDKATPYLMLIPALGAICFVHLYPSISAIKMSFYDINLLNPTRPFIGFGNYIELFNNPVILRVLLNTFFWTILSLILVTIFSLVIALQLNKSFRGRGTLRAVYLAPWVTPPIVIATVWKLVLSRDFSPISGLLMEIGIIDNPINFLGNPDTFLGFISIPMISLIIINVWNFLPFSMVMYSAGLQTIPNELYEAATVDGASSFQKFIRITLPMLMPVMEIVILLQGIWQFNNFNLSYLVTHGGPLNTTELVAVRIYNEAFTSFRYGFAASVSVVMALIALLPVLIYIKKTFGEETQLD